MEETDGEGVNDTNELNRHTTGHPRKTEGKTRTTTIAIYSAERTSEPGNGVRKGWGRLSLNEICLFLEHRSRRNEGCQKGREVFCLEFWFCL